jgi:CRISPR type III-B/RAMP module RAMP protein Cmr1
MSSWLDVQKNLVKDELIAEIDVETISLTRIGGYKATPYSLNLDLLTKPVAKSLKGVWRWWARTAVVGAYYGKIDYKKANEHLSKFFGNTKGIAKFKLEISDIKFPDKHEEKLNETIREIDKFYEGAKDFLLTRTPKLGLSQDKISIVLNPVEPKIIINTRGSLDINLKEKIKMQINEGPLKDFFKGEIKSTKKEKIEINLKISNLYELIEIPRIKILLMKRETEEDTLSKDNIDNDKILNYLKRIKEEVATLITEGMKFKIAIYGYGNDEEVNFALSSFLLSLIFGGIGSITKRAFGSLKISSFTFGNTLEIDHELKNIIQDLQSKDFTENELKNTIKKLCEIAIKYAQQSFKIPTIQSAQTIPLVPSLHNIKIEVKESSTVKLDKVGNAFLKQTWKRNFRISGKNLHTWILGLPRFQQKTGYAKKKNNNYSSERRISSIGVRYFKIKNRVFIILYGLLSSDWPEGLLHISRSKKNGKLIETPIEIRGSSLQNAFNYAFESVLKRCE